MPIRIVKDKNTNQRNTPPPRRERRRTNNTGGSGIAGALIPMVISMFSKKPKLLIGLAVVAVAVYFLGGKEACNGGSSLVNNNDGGGNTIQNLFNQFATGGELDSVKYEKTEIFEPLADNVKNPIPNSYSLKDFAPRRLNQGQQGSCVGWASSYAARTILQARMEGVKGKSNVDKIAFSPSFLYNQIAIPNSNCQGTYLTEAMKNLNTVGDLPFKNFKYDESSCNRKPNYQEKSAAAQYRIKGYNRLTKNNNNHKVDLLAIKQNIAQGAPVVIGMMVGGTFMQGMQGREVWMPSRADYNQRGFGGHAMCVIGYDDYKAGGSFQIMNSWGPGWGKDGIGWVRYKDFDYFTKEAYGLYPMGSKDEQNQTKLSVKFGLVNNQNGRNIPFVKANGITYKTAQDVKKGTQFKIESTNSIECYTYVFGQETDGSSYVLFPYTKKHSPYCGITGTRLFPKDHSLLADNIGTRDYMAVVVTKKPIDYNQLNRKISQASGSTYAEKITNALGRDMVQNVQFTTSNGTVNASCDTRGKNALAVVLEIDKN